MSKIPPDAGFYGKVTGKLSARFFEAQYLHLHMREYVQLKTFRSMENIILTVLHELAHINAKNKNEDEDHDLDFYVRNVALLIELEEVVDRGEIARHEVPTRATLEWGSAVM